MTPLTRLLAAALAAGALAAGADAARAAALPAPAGDAAGIELARKVNAYYGTRPLMGVEMRSPLPGGGVLSMKVVLKRGTMKAMVVTAAMGKERGTSVLTPRGGFVRLPGERCWTKIAPSAGDLGAGLIAMRGARFAAPESIGALTRLEVVEKDPATRATARTVYKIDAETGRVASLVSDGVALTLRTLPRAPAVPALKPVCKG
jgi:hypothetical protein